MLAFYLAKMVVHNARAGGSTLYWAVDDTLCRKQGLTLYGGWHAPRSPDLQPQETRWSAGAMTGSSSRSLIVHPFWAPTKVFALPVAARLYRNRQGLTKGKKGRTESLQARSTPSDPPPTRCGTDHAGRVVVPQRLRSSSAATSSTAAARAYSHLPSNVHLISHVHPRGRLLRTGIPRRIAPRAAEAEGTKTKRKGSDSREWTKWAEDRNTPWTELEFDQFGFHATVAVKTTRALYYKAGGDRLLTVVLVRDRCGQAPRPDVLLHQPRGGCTTNLVDLCFSLGD